MSQKRILVGVLAGVLAFTLIGAGYYVGYIRGTLSPKIIKIEGIENGLPEKNVKVGDADFSTFWEAWNILQTTHLKGKTLDAQVLLNGAIKGLAGATDDPYTEYFAPADSKKFEEDISGSFGGVGMEIGIKNDQLVVVAPLKGTPAERAGILAGDKITEIDGVSTLNLDTSSAVKKIRGEVGTKVKLLLLRNGWSRSKEFEIVRERIIIPTLEWSLKDGNIVYVQLSSFNDHAERLFSDAIRKSFQQGAKGIVLDLRNNPGGFLNVAVDLAGWFVPRGAIVVSEETANGSRTSLTASGNELLKNIPVVVLQNGGSASASEILAGALRDVRSIKLVGEKSFGKGTVQTVVPLHDDSSMKVTIAHWVLPSGAILEKAGLSPDIEVKMTEKDIEEKRDPQLAKALEVIREEIGAVNR